MQIYSLRNWPNRKVYSTFNEIFKHTNILQVCVYYLINFRRKQWLSVGMGLIRCYLDLSFPLLFYYMLYKNPSKAALFLLLYPWLFCRVTVSAKGIFMECLSCIARNTSYNENATYDFWEICFLKTLKR